ncbi:MAG: beta-galactosidase [Sphingobacteriales bacterium]|nr:MAG: beta-galactosidase [Sphingobacteriales bacterium]
MRIYHLFIASLLCQFVCAQSWVPAGSHIKTSWAEKVDPVAPHNDYPRPQMKRAQWQNLNGLWDYAITYVDDVQPKNFAGKILVPFAVESSLSGVGKMVGANNCLWYKRSFASPAVQQGQRLLLHFGAVDWQADVFINGKKAGSHQGGFDPFSFDITDLVNKGKANELVVRVWDPTDDGPQPRGKQVNKPSGIWYTPVTGIWQTVWLETVGSTYMQSVYTLTDIDQKALTVVPAIANGKDGDQVAIVVRKEGKEITRQTSSGEQKIIIPMANFRLWEPGSPELYDVELTVMRNGKAMDQVSTYTAFRKISLEKDADGIQWVMLNNKFLFQYGPLDQGWWPDGLYTAPTAEALLFDIVQTKAMGFNMIRKHTKVESALWYRYCDSLGMLVWQDMPSGDMNFSTDKWITNPSLEPIDKTRTPASEAIYRTELKAMIDALRPFPSIVVWVPFNEAWGQFKTVEISEWTKAYDPYRLVNAASGGNFHAVGDMHDLHNYPDPQIHRPEVFGKDRAVVLGEFGGLGLPIENHTWTDKSNWGYQSFTTKDELMTRYKSLITKLETLIPKGMSAAVYTQTTDVESEVNGLMSYDRKVMKFDPEAIFKINQKLYTLKTSLRK